MICLLPTAYKLLSTVLLHRMRLECEGFLQNDQAGFRRHRGCRDGILILTELIAQIQEEGQAMAEATANEDPECLASIAFLDYIAAFDSVDHVFLDEAMKVSGASLKTRAIIRSIYQSASAVVRARDSSGFTVLSSAFSIDRGVVQGDIVSPYCFILALQLIYLRHDDNPDTSNLRVSGPSKITYIKMDPLDPIRNGFAHGRGSHSHFYTVCSTRHEPSMIPKALKIATLQKKMAPIPPHT